MIYAVIDKRLPDSCKQSLVNSGFGIIEMPPFSALGKAVASHPDMLFFVGDRLFCHCDYKAYADKLASVVGLEIETTNETVSESYPNDVLFNAARIDNYIFCRKESISALIKRYAERCGLEIVDVRQGYTKCSVCVVSERAVITADKGIALAAEKHGIDVLRIIPGGVRLDGCSYGFIGGASGVYSDKVYFCGNLSLHPNGKDIIGFCEKHGKTAVSLSEEPLFDAGTIMFMPSV